jgi:hypothetical protein
VASNTKLWLCYCFKPHSLLKFRHGCYIPTTSQNERTPTLVFSGFKHCPRLWTTSKNKVCLNHRSKLNTSQHAKRIPTHSKSTLKNDRPKNFHFHFYPFLKKWKVHIKISYGLFFKLPFTYISSLSDTSMDNFVYVDEVTLLRSQRPNSVHSKCIILRRILILMMKKWMTW